MPIFYSMKHILRRCLAALIFFAALQGLFAEFFSNDEVTFAFDLPEGYVLTGFAEDGSSYLLKSGILPVELVVRVYPKGEMTGAAAALDTVKTKLSARGEVSEFTWRGQACAISPVTLKPQGYASPQAGWALASPLPDTGGFLVCVAFAPSPLRPPVESFIIATLDSLHIDEESFLSSGPVTAFAYPESPEKRVNLSIAGVSIPAPLQQDDSEAQSFVIEREFGALTLYADSPLRDAAWQRYYRAVYRDAYARLAPAAQGIVKALEKSNPGQNREEYLLRALLAWTQGFSYTRNFSSSDFEPLPSILEGGGSDCDSRSMLLAVILNSAGCNAVMFFSPEYKHAVLGVAIGLPGAKINLEGVDYLLAETTAQVAPGLIAKEMSDTNKWIPVIFPQ